MPRRWDLWERTGIEHHALVLARLLHVVVQCVQQSLPWHAEACESGWAKRGEDLLAPSVLHREHAQGSHRSVPGLLPGVLLLLLLLVL
eukprot:COSAG02_NODE_31548_length_531_cov_1.479167_1_plen_87_part_10